MNFYATKYLGTIGFRCVIICSIISLLFLIKSICSLHKKTDNPTLYRLEFFSLPVCNYFYFFDQNVSVPHIISPNHQQ